MLMEIIIEILNLRDKKYIKEIFRRLLRIIIIDL